MKPIPSWNKLVTTVDARNFEFIVIYELIFTNKNVSHQIASEFDDIAIGNFAYRDYTKSGLPFCTCGEIYWSYFWFEFLTDAKRFQSPFGGTGSWEDNFNHMDAVYFSRRHLDD